MNSYERVMKALSFQEPDRVPIAEFLIDKRIYTALMPSAKEQYDFDVEFGLDVLASRAWYQTVSEQGNQFTDEWGIIYSRNEETVAHPVKAPIHDIRDFKTFKVPSADHEGRLSNLPKIVKNHKKERPIAYGMRAMFLWAANLVGLENLLANMMMEPGFVHEILDTILQEQIKLARIALRAGADIIIETDDYAFNKGPLFSPYLFDVFITPRLKHFADAVHEEGGYLLKHTDGNIMAIMDSFIKAGIDGLQSIDPIASMDMGEMKDKYGTKISLWGNIDCGNLLAHGSEEDVKEAVCQCIKKGAKGGGFVLMSSNSIPHSAKPENFLSMLKYGREYGKYSKD
jgi:uroporphyrinogen decarboxylase